VSVKTEGENIIILVEPTTYYYSFVTNFSCDLTLGSGRTLRIVLEPLILTGDPNNPLKSINESSNLPISNHVGINILFVTQDGYLLLSKRSSFVAVE
jgi:hypothetical protein